MKYISPRHYCWWCKDLLEEGDIHHYRSGWLCDKCKAYLESVEPTEHNEIWFAPSPSKRKRRKQMDRYTIVIMDYTSGSLRFYYFDNEPEDPEEWIRTHDKNWSDSSCYWMGVKGNGINEDHIYNADTLKEVDDAEG